MSKVDSDVLKHRMNAAKAASELAASDDALARIFQVTPSRVNVRVAPISIDLLCPFHTADIGFRPYPQAKLEAFAIQLQQEGQLEPIIVRPIEDGRYEILAGHNRVGAAKLNGWDTILAQIVDADDARAIVIATSTNLLRRQDLSIIEQGKAYRALLEAKRRQGFRSDLSDPTSGEIRPKFSARELVAEFFGVTEYEIRKAVKLTQLIPEIQSIIEEYPKRINLACADMVTDYDVETQKTFLLIFQREDLKLDMSAMKYISRKCPPPSAQHKEIVDAWNEVRRRGELRMMAPPKKISFDRKKFAPYIEKLGSDQELEKLFLEFLQHRLG